MERIKKQVQTHLKNKSICIVIGKSRSGKSTLCEDIIKEYDFIETFDKDILSKKQQSNVVSFFIKTSKKPVCIYIDALETHTERNVMEKCKTANEMGYPILINTTKTSGFPAYVEKVYMPSAIFPQKVEYHEPDVFYDVPYKTAQKIMGCWTSGKTPTEDMYYSDAFVIEGFLYDNYPNYTDIIERTAYASEIFSYSDVLDGYKQRHQYYPIGGYVGMGMTAHLASKLKKGMSSNMKCFFPLIHIKYGKAKRRLDKLTDKSVISDVGAIFNTGDMLEKRKVPAYVYGLYPEIFDAFEFKGDKKLEIKKKEENMIIKKKEKHKKIENSIVKKREPKLKKENNKIEISNIEIIEPISNIENNKLENIISEPIKPSRKVKIIEETDELSSKTLIELRELCKSKNITGYSKFKKDELISYIKSKLNSC
jgi:hypothetical protein